jgi:hypothetical protein
MTAYLDLTTNAQALPTVIAAETLGALSSNMALLGLVNRDYSNEVASFGQTVRIVNRGTLSVNAKAENVDVTLQAPTSTAVNVTLNQHNEVTFGEEDIATMLQRPDLMAGYAEDAAIALLEEVESDIAALYTGFSQSITATSGLGEDDFREAKRLLDAAKVPSMGRWAALHEDAASEALSIDRIINRDYAESVGNVRPANLLGRAYGFDIYMDQNITVASSICRNLFGHRNAIALVTRPMRTTNLNTVSQVTMAENGIVLRVTRWYDAQGLAEQMTIDLLYGVAELRDNHAVVVTTTEV